MKEKKKILWVNNAFGFGGAERQMLYMYDILKQYCDMDITILYYAKMKDELNLDGVKTIFVDKDKIGKVNTIREIHKYIKREKFQLVHAFGGCTANIYGRFAAIFTGAVPVGALLGKASFRSRGIRIVNSFLNLFGNWWTVNNVDLIPVLTRNLTFLSMKKIRLLHNGFVPTECIDYHIANKTEFDFDKGENFVFCSVGRLHPVKNYGLYLRAAEKIMQKYDKVRFWIVGDGEEYEKLTALSRELKIEDKVRFWGCRKDTDDILYRCDTFVQTSFTEGSPNTIAEAMRAGKPVVSTKSTDLSEMIEDDKNGYLVENDNVERLAEAMEKMLLKTEEERMAMGKYSQKLFEKTFLAENVAKEFERFYDEVLQ